MSVKKNFKGSIENQSVSTIIRSVAERKLNGKLFLFNEKEKVSLCFKNGVLKYAYSNIEELNFSDYLFMKNKITLDEYEKLVDNYNLEDIPKGLISLNEKEIIKERKRNARETIFYVLNWESGNFSFLYEECSFLGGNIVLNLYEVIVKGFRKNENWNKIREFLYPYENIVIFDTSFDPNEAKEIRLDREENYVLSLVDGTRTVREIIGKSKLWDFETAGILYAFAMAKILMLKKK